MAAPLRPPRAAEIVLGTVFALAGLVLLYVAAFKEGHWPSWAAGLLLLILAGFAVIPEWRNSFGSNIGRISKIALLDWFLVHFRADSTQVATPPGAEKPPEALLPAQPGLGAAIKEDLGARVLEGLKDVDDPLAYWSIAVNLMRRQDYGSAGVVIEAALERHPDHPKLLISAGYLWARQSDYSKAIQAAKRAAAGAKDREDFREQYYLANANLCYYLAERADARDRTSALEAGRLASDHADEFSSRDSFKINYGFAQVRFASSREEVVQAVSFLLDLHRRDLNPQQRVEVNQYLQLGFGKLVALDTPPQGASTA